MKHSHKVTVIVGVGAVLLGLLIGCAVQSPSQAASSEYSSEYSTEFVHLDDGRTVTCLVLDKGVNGVAMSCDWVNASK